MKTKIKFLVIGMVVMLILTNVAFADLFKEKIELAFENIKLKIEDKEIESKSINYNGELYVPVTFIEDYFDKEVVLITEDGEEDVISSDEMVKEVTIEGVTVRIIKAVQDADSLKLYVEYVNNTDDTVLLSESLAKIISNGTQYKYDTEFNFNRYYNKDVEKAPHSIEPTVTAKSVLFFEPIEDVDTINVVLSADFEDFKFNDIKVNK